MGPWSICVNGSIEEHRQLATDLPSAPNSSVSCNGWAGVRSPEIPGSTVCLTCVSASREATGFAPWVAVSVHEPRDDAGPGRRIATQMQGLCLLRPSTIGRECLQTIQVRVQPPSGLFSPANRHLLAPHTPMRTGDISQSGKVTRRSRRLDQRLNGTRWSSTTSRQFPSQTKGMV
jgi:hypothetical protein